MSLKLEDYDFKLPESCIAQNPAVPRDHSRLFHIQRETDTRAHRHFYDLPDILCAGDVLVFNDTRVIAARLYAQVEGMQNANAEVLLLRELGEGRFSCMVRPGKRFKVGKRVSFAESSVSAQVQTVAEDGTRELLFEGGSSVVRALIEAHGKMPLPPYIKNSSAADTQYQTVYAREGESVAAPTAGLHFTPELLAKLAAKGVQTEYLRLDVGRGTFLGVDAENIKDHLMHEERYFLTAEVAGRLNDAKAQGRRIIAVGTTSVRVLETVAREDGRLREAQGETDIFIYPGFSWKFVDGLITNFHLPKSTLLMLVSSFWNRESVLSAYEQAVRDGYRFYSFGDAMFLE